MTLKSLLLFESLTGGLCAQDLRFCQTTATALQGHCPLKTSCMLGNVVQVLVLFSERVFCVFWSFLQLSIGYNIKMRQNSRRWTLFQPLIHWLDGSSLSCGCFVYILALWFLGQILIYTSKMYVNISWLYFCDLLIRQCDQMWHRR